MIIEQAQNFNATLPLVKALPCLAHFPRHGHTLRLTIFEIFTEEVRLRAKS